MILWTEMIDKWCFCRAIKIRRRGGTGRRGDKRKCPFAFIYTPPRSLWSALCVCVRASSSPNSHMKQYIYRTKKRNPAVLQFTYCLNGKWHPVPVISSPLLCCCYLLNKVHTMQPPSPSLIDFECHLKVMTSCTVLSHVTEEDTIGTLYF